VNDLKDEAEPYRKMVMEMGRIVNASKYVLWTVSSTPSKSRRPKTKSCLMRSVLSSML